MGRAICWHASGAIPSSVLKPLKDAGAEIGSIHPAKSFADPASAAETFAGTPCVIDIGAVGTFARETAHGSPAKAIISFTCDDGYVAQKKWLAPTLSSASAEVFR